MECDDFELRTRNAGRDFALLLVDRDELPTSL